MDPGRASIWQTARYAASRNEDKGGDNRGDATMVLPTLSPPRDDVPHRVLLISADCLCRAASTNNLLQHAALGSVGGKLAANLASMPMSSLETVARSAEFRRWPFNIWSQHSRARHT